jgi:hypothetical protein
MAWTSNENIDPSTPQTRIEAVLFDIGLIPILRHCYAWSESLASQRMLRDIVICKFNEIKVFVRYANSADRHESFIVSADVASSSSIAPMQITTDLFSLSSVGRNDRGQAAGLTKACSA